MKSNNRIKFLECKVALLGAMLSLTVWIFNSSALAGPERIPDKNVVVPQQEVVVPFSWSGFYVGANVGGNWTHSDFGHHFTGVAAGAIEDFSEGETDPGSEEFTAADEDFVTYSIPSASGNSDISFLGGGQLGYQQQFGHFVIGVEVDFDGATGNGDRATTTNNFVTPMFTTPGNTDGDTVNFGFEEQAPGGSRLAGVVSRPAWLCQWTFLVLCRRRCGFYASQIFRSRYSHEQRI